MIMLRPPPWSTHSEVFILFYSWINLREHFKFCCVNLKYRSVPGKRPWALNHKPSFSPYWELRCLQRVNFEIGAVGFMGVALARYAYMCVYAHSIQNTFA